jgi:threonylcarbamoyladenosine tRNA methylthiotransferase MtaB
LIINTCTVTAKGAMQSRQAARRAIREHPGALVVATGCAVQAQPSDFTTMRGLHYLIGNTEKHRIPEIIGEAPPLDPPKTPVQHRQPALTICELPETPLPASRGRARPHVKIQDGCSDFCAYCIVPHTRGPSRSLPLRTVLSMIRKLSRGGAKEAVLTGIHLGRYGADLKPPSSLFSLLDMIDREKAIDRIRLSSIEPAELSPKIIGLAKKSRRICPHFHIPLQSGDKGVLDKMKRPYTPALFERLIASIHAELPHAAIGVDVMAGFPGEDEEAFSHTLALLETLPVAYLHVFPFSPRPMTPARRYTEQVPARIIKERAERLRALGREKRRAFYERQVGRVVEIICEEHREPRTGYVKGVSENYLSVLTDAPDHYRNDRVSCRLTGPVTGEGIFGRCEPPTMNR